MIETKENILKNIKKIFFKLDLSYHEKKFLDFLFINLEKQNKNFLELYKNELLKWLEIIKMLLVNYDIQQLINFSLNELLFYNNIYSTYLYHNKLKSKIKEYISYDTNFVKKGIKFTISIGISTINTGGEKNQDFTNGITLSIFNNEGSLFTSSFYIGKEEVFISNLQYSKLYFLSKNIRNIKLYRIGILFAYLIGKAFNKKYLVGYSNLNHCCNFHPGFYGQYDIFFKSSGFDKSNGFWRYTLINSLNYKYLKEKGIFNNYILLKDGFKK